jgi:hypothetical protein
MGETDQRFEVQARLLGGQADAAIGAACRLASETIRWFASLFFDTRERLDSRAGRLWIRREVIGLEPAAKADWPQPGRLLMALGFHCGYRVLEVLLAVMRNRRLPDWVAGMAPNDIVGYEARLRLLGRLALDVMTVQAPVHPHDLQRVYRRLLDLHSHSAEDGEPVVRWDLAAFLNGALTRPGVIPASWTSASLPPDLSAAERELLCPSSGIPNCSGPCSTSAGTS